MARCVVLVLLLFLSSCNLEPRYDRTCMEMPHTWRFEYDEGSTIANIRWWESLGDSALNELIFAALNNNKDLMVAVWRVHEFFARFQVVRSELFPKIDLNASAVRQKINPASTLTPSAGIVSIFSYAFNASYEADLWGKMQSEAHAAYSEALASIQNRRTVVLTLVAATATAYVQLRELDRELEIAFRTLEDRKEFLRLAILRFQGGLTSEIEVTQAAAAYEEVLADVTLLEELIPEQENLISVLIGTSSRPIIRGVEIDKFGYPPVIPAGLPSELLQRRPDILEAELKLIAANAEIGAARAAFFPQVKLTALFGGTAFQLSDLFKASSQIWRLGVDIMQPIFRAGELIGELNVSIAQKKEALYTYEQAILVAFKEVNDALISSRQAKQLVLAQEGNVAANKEYFRLSWLRYYNGQTDYLTVLDAETRLFEAEIQLTQAQASVYFALIDLYKALGGGWVIDADCVLRSCN